MPAGILEHDEMAYVGREPWHGLGVKVEGDAMTAKQAILATGMDWTVELHPVYASVTYPYGMKNELIDDKNAVVRMDTGDVLGVVGTKYEPVQNVDCFNLFDAVVGTGEAKYDTVGTLGNGRRIWLLANFKEGITLDNGEEIKSYMLLTNSHDGSKSLTMQWCDIRVVCQNTFEMAIRSQGDIKKGLQRFKARHTKNIMLKANEARTILALQNQYRQILEEEINLIAETEWSSQDMQRLTYDLFNLDVKRPLEEQHGSQKANAELVQDLFVNGIGNKGKTAWDAYNAVSEFTSHYKGYGRSVDSIGAITDKVVSNRLNNNWFGDGATMRNRVWDIVTADEDTKESMLPSLVFAQ